VPDSIERDDLASEDADAVKKRPIIVPRFNDWSGPAKVRAIAVLLVVIVVSWGFAGSNYRNASTPNGPAEARGAVSSDNGFDVSNAIIPKHFIRRGGPPRDGIPAILEPNFIPAADVTYLKETDEVLGFIHEGEAHAYPLRILVWHEIANDTVGGLPIAATYCPLCGTCMVFSREYGGETLTFGVSGLLYQSDVLMYDHQTESLWSQLMMKSISGEHVDTELAWLDSKQMTWAAWKQQFPDSMVMSTDTGFGRNYARAAYESYKNSDRVMFPVPETRTELGRKEWVLGVVIGDEAKAFPIAELSGLELPLEDTIGGQNVIVMFDVEAQFASVVTDTGDPVPSVKVYWFAWQGFYPDTSLYAP